jgi:hypothetical protein
MSGITRSGNQGRQNATSQDHFYRSTFATRIQPAE